MVSTSLLLRAPEDFRFLPTVYSHGWYALPPFQANGTELHRSIGLPGGRVVHCRLMEASRGVSVRVTGPSLSLADRRDVAAQLRTCLRLDEDFTGFHREARRHVKFRWIAASRAGRLLRSPTVFEDVVKTLCTTNCTWALTTLMARNLVESLGPRNGDGIAGFPGAEAIAGTSERFLRSHIKAGYRAPYLLELADKVASGRLDVESWRRSGAPAESLYADIRSLKGMGPYAVGSVLKLLGRYEHLALDSWVRARYYVLHHKGRKVRDSTIERFYGSLGQWKGLFFWLEMTQNALTMKIRTIPRNQL